MDRGTRFQCSRMVRGQGTTLRWGCWWLSHFEREQGRGARAHCGFVCSHAHSYPWSQQLKLVRKQAGREQSSEVRGKTGLTCLSKIPRCDWRGPSDPHAILFSFLVSLAVKGFRSCFAPVLCKGVNLGFHACWASILPLSCIPSLPFTFYFWEGSHWIVCVGTIHCSPSRSWTWVPPASASWVARMTAIKCTQVTISICTLLII